MRSIRNVAIRPPFWPVCPETRQKPRLIHFNVHPRRSNLDEHVHLSYFPTDTKDQSEGGRVGLLGIMVQYTTWIIESALTVRIANPTASRDLRPPPQKSQSTINYTIQWKPIHSPIFLNTQLQSIYPSLQMSAIVHGFERS